MLSETSLAALVLFGQRTLSRYAARSLGSQDRAVGAGRASHPVPSPRFAFPAPGSLNS